MERTSIRQTERDRETIKEQFIQMEEFLQEIGCAVFMSDDYEADDYAASLVEV